MTSQKNYISLEFRLIDVQLYLILEKSKTLTGHLPKRGIDTKRV